PSRAHRVSQRDPERAAGETRSYNHPELSPRRPRRRGHPAEISAVGIGSAKSATTYDLGRYLGDSDELAPPYVLCHTFFMPRERFRSNSRSLFRLRVLERSLTQPPDSLNDSPNSEGREYGAFANPYQLVHKQQG